MTGPGPKACVFGWAIEQSCSPLIHRYWLSESAISGQYERVAAPPKDIEVS